MLVAAGSYELASATVDGVTPTGPVEWGPCTWMGYEGVDSLSSLSGTATVQEFGAVEVTLAYRLTCSQGGEVLRTGDWSIGIHGVAYPDTVGVPVALQEVGGGDPFHPGDVTFHGTATQGEYHATGLTLKAATLVGGVGHQWAFRFTRD